MSKDCLDAICIGEALIDFVSTEKNVELENASRFLKSAGGAPANVSVGLARLGKRVAFVGKVGDDSFGRFLAKTLENNGVDVSNLLFDKKHSTRLAFVSLTDEGERDFEFYGDESADMKIRKEEIDKISIENAKIIHFGSISLISNPSRDAILTAVRTAKAKNTLVSFDPNLRLSLWESSDNARLQIKEALGLADIVKMDMGEMEFITDSADLKAGARYILERGVRLLVITLGKDGCYFFSDKTEGKEPGFDVKVRDTTGAGDGFVAGMLAKILEIPFDSLTTKDLHGIFRFANAVAALTVTRYGGIPALPYREEVESFCNL